MSANDKAAATYGPGRTAPPLEARVAAVLGAHQYDPEGCVCTCSNEVQVGLRCDSQTHSQHVAAMLAPVIREAQADLVDVLADLIDDTQNGHDIAECAAYTPGETGRQACIDAWEELIEEPAEWLRKKAAEHRGHERDRIQEMLYDAWQSGCEEAMDAAGYAPGPRNAMYDRNPYKEEA